MYYEKYKKYKNKYLALKNIIGGSDPDFERAIKASLADLNEGDVEVGRKLYVIPNSGMIEGMSQQCFWIFILNYLQRNPIDNIAEVENVGQLRTLVGLGKDTEHLPFDEDDIRFRNALESLTAIFDLQIVVHFINAHGNQIIIRDHRTGIPKEAIRPINDGGSNIVHITQHGLYHFQYMVAGGVGAGDNGVLVQDKLSKDKNIENITNNETMVKVYEEEIKKLNQMKVKMDKEFKPERANKEDLEIFYISYNDEINRINKEITKYEEKLEVLRKYNKTKFIKRSKIEAMIKELEDEIKKLDELKIKMDKEFNPRGVSPSELENYYISYNEKIEKINREINKKKQQIIKKELEIIDDKLEHEYLRLAEQHKK